MKLCASYQILWWQTVFVSEIANSYSCQPLWCIKDMRKIILIATLILSWCQLFSQDYPTKKELKKLFSEKQEYLGELDWETCNDDSSYYKNDTIRLYNRNTVTVCLNQERCCEKVDWTFFNGNSFGLSKTSRCQEPPLSTAIGPDDRYKIKIKTVDTILELHIKNSKSQTEILEVVSLIKCEGDYMAYGKHGYELILKRKK